MVNLSKRKWKLTLAFADIQPQIATAMPPERFPVANVANGRFPAAALQPQFAFTSSQIDCIVNALPSVGRIESKYSNSFFYGTGFAVGPNLIATNRHVAESFVIGVGRGNNLQLSTQSCVINFRREGEDQPGTKHRIVEAVLVHPYWDIALLRTATLPASIKRLVLVGNVDSATADRTIAVVGYPAAASGSGRYTTAASAAANEIFGIENGIKRVQPGRLRGPPAPMVVGGPASTLDHSASTLPGNSGSPVLDIDSGVVLGVHFGGIDDQSNWSVPCGNLACDRRISSLEGLSFLPAGVPDVAGPWETKWDEIGDVFEP